MVPGGRERHAERESISMKIRTACGTSLLSMIVAGVCSIGGAAPAAHADVTIVTPPSGYCNIVGIHLRPREAASISASIPPEFLGKSIAVDGQRFFPAVPVTIYLDGVEMAIAHTNCQGSFSLELTRQCGVASEVGDIEAIDAYGHEASTALVLLRC
jgi:hypothetical protein